jgi:hypothetical protein
MAAVHPKGRVARDLVTSAFRQSRVQRVKVLCRGTSRNPEPRSADSAQSGPTVSRGSLSRPSEADTWRAIRLPAFSPIAISKCKKQLPHIPMREVTRASRAWGPQQHRVNLGPSDLRETRGAQLSHLGVSPIVAMIRKVQHRRIPDARGVGSVQDPNPQHHRGAFRTVRSRGARGARLSRLDVSLIMISRSKD